MTSQLVPDVEPKLAEMPTDWELVNLAHRDSSAESLEARRRLVEPYLRPAWKYLLSATRDADISSELLSEFWLRFERGHFKNANPQKGSLGSLIKLSLARMVTEFRRRQNKNKEAIGLVPFCDEIESPESNGHLDPIRSAAIKNLLEMAWQQMSRFEEEHTLNLHFTVLKLRECYPDDSCDELAQILSPLVEKQLSPNAVRILLHDARCHFARAIWTCALQCVESGLPDDATSLLQEFGLWNSIRQSLTIERARTVPTVTGG
jgi:RNA polymerase sigma-70 factor (ECF subfamily)